MTVDKLDYEVRIKVSKQMWIKIHHTMRDQDYTLSEYIRECVRRDQHCRDLDLLSLTTRCTETEE